jgi:pimeloyl-ACP methyl ester carboxylesterase
MTTLMSASKLLQKLLAIGAVFVLSVGLARCSDGPAKTTAPEPPPSGMSCLGNETRPLPSGAPYQVCADLAHWNGDLVVFVPGYRNPSAGPSLPNEDIGGISAAETVTAMGYAYATTGFRQTGLVVPDTWIGEDLLAVVERAKSFLQRPVGRVYLTGGSQGGLITTLGVERYPDVFTGGGLAACGPIGSYRKQLEYVGDFRAVFDFYFAPVITTPEWPVWTQSPPSNGMVDPAFWNQASQAAVVSALQANPGRTANLLSVTSAPIDSTNRDATTQETVLGLLYYSFEGTNDAIAKLSGFPFGNVGRAYTGSSDSVALNNGIQRFTFTASEPALQKLETSGQLSRPLVTIHTTGDPIVPVWHEALYQEKVSHSDAASSLYSQSIVNRYGHCAFTAEEVLGAFAQLVRKATGQDLVLSPRVLPDPRSQAEFLRAARAFGAAPRIASR